MQRIDSQSYCPLMRCLLQSSLYILSYLWLSASSLHVYYLLSWTVYFKSPCTFSPTMDCMVQVSSLSIHSSASLLLLLLFLSLFVRSSVTYRIFTTKSVMWYCTSKWFPFSFPCFSYLFALIFQIFNSCNIILSLLFLHDLSLMNIFFHFDCLFCSFFCMCVCVSDSHSRSDLTFELKIMIFIQSLIFLHSVHTSVI